MEKSLRIALVICSIPLLGLGFVTMFDVNMVLDKWGVTALDNNGLSTIRSIVGGLLVGSAIQIVVGIWRRNSTWLLASAVLMGVIIFGRIVGLVLDGFHSAIVGPTIFEAVALVLAVIITGNLGQLVRKIQYNYLSGLRWWRRR